MRTKIRLILNGKAATNPEVREAVQLLRDEGHVVDVRVTWEEGDAARLVAEALRDPVDRVVAGGGDGTINQIFAAAFASLANSDAALGILPLGTANDLARTLDIPPDPLKAAAIIVAGRSRAIDLGEVNRQLFFNVASIGFSAELAAELSEKAKRYLGKLGYGVVAARLLARSRLFTAYLEHDGGTEKVRTLQVSVGNGKYYGGGMSVEESAAPDDGLLDFYSLEVDHWWRLLSLLPSLRAGTHTKWDDVRAFKTKELTIKTSRPRPVNTDGELTTWTPAHFRLRPRAISVYAGSTDESDLV